MKVKDSIIEFDDFLDFNKNIKQKYTTSAIQITTSNHEKYPITSYTADNGYRIYCIRIINNLCVKDEETGKYIYTLDIEGLKSEDKVIYLGAVNSKKELNIEMIESIKFENNTMQCIFAHNKFRNFEVAILVDKLYDERQDALIRLYCLNVIKS